jgi:cytoskeletal protein CcmA (bactofilin family)
MFKFRKAASSAYENTNQTIQHEDEEDVPMKQSAHELQTLLSELQPPANGKNLDLAAQTADGTAHPHVLAQIEMAKRYPFMASASMESASPEESSPEFEDSDATRLSIGSAIKLKGSVEDCDFIQVNGYLEGSTQSKELIVAESGTFIGNAAVDNAQIFGRFEGELTVGEKLVIRTAGIVAGTVRYGSISIESGGQISGNIQALSRNGTHNEPHRADIPFCPETPEPAPEQNAPQPDPSTFRRDQSDMDVSSIAGNFKEWDYDE